MSRAQRRHDAQTVFARRKAQWIAVSRARGGLGHMNWLKNTARPCSCPVCKRPRYVREPKHARVEQS